MFSLGVPVSRHYFSNYFSAQLARMRNIYKKNIGELEMHSKLNCFDISKHAAY